jgi:hypothetical protein
VACPFCGKDDLARATMMQYHALRRCKKRPGWFAEKLKDARVKDFIIVRLDAAGDVAANGPPGVGETTPASTPRLRRRRGGSVG